MQSLAVVDLLDEGADVLAGVIDVAVVSAVDLLRLERLHEALCLGIVVRVADPAHAGLDVVLGKYDGVFGACVLDAPIGVMDEATRLRVSLCQGHFQRCHGLCPQRSSLIARYVSDGSHGPGGRRSQSDFRGG